jgi:nitroreductase
MLYKFTDHPDQTISPLQWGGDKNMSQAKPAPVNYPVHDLIANRWSPRAFDPQRPVGSAELCQLLEAARWSASCSNEQPWQFIVTTHSDPSSYAKLLECLVPANAVWAKNAPVLLLVLARTTFKRNDSSNDWALYDAGQAAASLVIQATALGLVAHQMAGFDATLAISHFQIPSTIRPLAVIALGYGADPSTLPTPELQQRETAPRTRIDLTEFTFGGNWGEPWAELR